MKTITIKQPWASLIVEGIKDIENRTWPTKFRGRVLIHAAVKPIKLEFEIEGQATAKEIMISSTLNKCEENNLFGTIIGSVEIVDCVLNHDSIWAQHKALVERKVNGEKVIVEVPVYNWVLANPILFPEPIPCKGRLLFWDYPNILAEPEEEGGSLYCHCRLPVKEEHQVRPNGDGTYSCRYCGGKWYK